MSYFMWHVVPLLVIAFLFYCGTCEEMNILDAAFPIQVILMRVKKEASNFNGDQSKYNSQTFDQTFQAYEKKYAPLFWNNSGKSMNPSMQSLRGRIVVLQDFNGDVGAHT